MRMILTLGAAVLGAYSATASPQPQVSSVCAPGAVSRAQHAVIAARASRYTVCVGAVPIRDASGQVRASIVYTAYMLGSRPDRSRPLSFIWNGGPGSDSRLLQFHALAPKKLRNGALVDNSASPLPVSDLVFVDPVGTGFSRPVTPEAGAEFYRTTGDIAAIAQFVRRLRSDLQRTGSPTYLVGESFGTWRAAGVAEALIDASEPLAGIALISGGIPVGAGEDRALARALSLPNRTATALALGRLAPDLQADPTATLASARRWARASYYPALANPEALSNPALETLVRELARFQGLPEAAIDTKTLWVSPRQFRTSLIPGKALDIFDMRKIASSAAPGRDDRAVIDFYRKTIGYTAGSYAGIDEKGPDVGGEWQYDQSPITPESLARAQAGEGPPSASQPWTLRALQKSPQLLVWVAAGQYDSLNSCAGNEATVESLPPELRERFSLHCYAGGHMMYEDPAVSDPFGHDLGTFIRR